MFSRLLASTAVLALAAATGSASAQTPQSPTVAAGSISITRQGATTVVTQRTDKGIIDWRSFSIGSQNAVVFDQPGRSSVTLNRVTGTEASRIDGALSANGQVWLANPNGVMIGPGGQVNVGGLLATTGRIDSGDFLTKGRAAIDQIDLSAAIVNAGRITVGEGGYAALAAAATRNEGTIAARAGMIAFGAGRAMTLDFNGDKLISYQVTHALEQAPAGADALITNTGTLAAQNGAVVMSARAAKGVIDSVVNLKGHAIANQVKIDGGTVVLGDGGSVRASGRIDASNPAGQGGEVTILGERVAITEGASIDASGAAGGVALIGGDYQGAGQIGAQGRNAQFVSVASNASISVDAAKGGQGGKLVVWSDKYTAFGGVAAAKEGMVEVSSKGALDFSGTVKASHLTLDPKNIIVDATGAGPVSTGYADNPSADSTLSAALLASTLAAGTAVTLQASNDITVKAAINVSGTTGGALTLQAGRSIVINASITTANGNLTLIANDTSAAGVVSAQRDSGAAAITVASGAALNAGTGALSLRLSDGAGRANNLSGDVLLQNATAGVFNVVNAGPSAGAIALQGTIKVSGANLELSSLGSITFESGSRLTYSGASGANLRIAAGRDVKVDTSTIESTGGALAVRLTAGAQATTQADVLGGIFLSTASIISKGGAINLGAGSSGGLSATGVSGATYGGTTALNGASLVSSTLDAGAGTISIKGAARSDASTVYALGVGLTGSTLTALGGVSLIGIGGDAATLKSTGVQIEGSSTIISNGAVTVSGTGGNLGAGDGVGFANGSILVGGSGSITITGVRGAGSGSNNILVVGTSVISTALGNVDLNADATVGGGTKSNGIWIQGSGTVSTGGGNIRMTGASAAQGISNNDGVSISGLVETQGAGTIEIIGGRGGGGGGTTIPSENIIIAGGTITSGGGAITITGATSTPSGSGGPGVLMYGGGKVASTSGAVTLSGAGSGGRAGVEVGDAAVSTGGAGGVLLKTDSYSFGAASKLSTAGGAIAMQALTPGVQITLENSFLSAASGGPILFGSLTQNADILVAANLVLPGAVTIQSGTGNVNFLGSVSAGAGQSSLNVSTSGGTINFSGGSIATKGTQSYGGAVALAGATSFKTTNAAVTFASKVYGPGALSAVTGGGSVLFAGGIDSATLPNGVSVNGQTVRPPDPTPPTITPPVIVTPTVPVKPTAPSVATVASTPSVATVASTPSQPSVASVPSSAATFTVAATSEVKEQIPKILPRPPEPQPPGGNNPGYFEAPPFNPSAPSPASASAQVTASIVTATPLGGLIPASSPRVTSTGAPLASAQTVKVDPVDTGGGNGQVVFNGGIDFGAGSNGRVILPGMLTMLDSRRGGAGSTDDAPLADRPSEINDEMLFD